MSKFRFKPDDFTSYKYPSNERPSVAFARCANELLDEHLAKCPVVYGLVNERTEKFDWSEFIYDGFAKATHKAVLFNIEELVKEECKHEPTHVFIGPDTGHWSTQCKHCGIKLKATWEAAE